MIISLELWTSLLSNWQRELAYPIPGTTQETITSKVPYIRHSDPNRPYQDSYMLGSYCPEGTGKREYAFTASRIKGKKEVSLTNVSDDIVNFALKGF